MAQLLEREIQTYEKNRERLLGEAEGKFVLIRDDEIVGVYESKADAIAQAYRQFGNVPFLVKQILRIEVPQDYVSNLLGI
jgi:hypothetical protein